MAPSFLALLSYDLQVFFLSMWLDVPSLVNLDVALSCRNWRAQWMTLLHSVRSAGIDEWGHSYASLMWLTRRGICARRMQMKVDGWRVRGRDLILLLTIELVHLGLNGCCWIMTDQCVMNVIHQCRNLKGLDISRCTSLTDAGVIALGAGCGQLQSINLADCSSVTDAGVTALVAGCGQLQSINLGGCRNVTDAGMSALGAGCGLLQSINLGGCSNVTDAGILALGAGCGQLQSINLEGCNNVTDAGMSALGAGCGLLQSINLGGCNNVTDAGITALRAGCGQLHLFTFEDRNCFLRTSDAIVN